MAKGLIIRIAYYIVKKIKRNRESNQTVYRKILSIILLLSFKINKISCNFIIKKSKEVRLMLYNLEKTLFVSAYNYLS